MSAVSHVKRNFTELFMSWDWFQLSASEWKTPSWGTQTIICFNYQEAENILANYTFSVEPCLFKFCVYSLSSYLVTTGEPHFLPQRASQRFSAEVFFFLLFLQCCTVSWSCVLFFGWRSQLDLWEGWVSYCLSCCVLMECRNLYASFHSSFIAIDFWLSPLPVLKGDVATEKMSVSQ